MCPCDAYIFFYENWTHINIIENMFRLQYIIWFGFYELPFTMWLYNFLYTLPDSYVTCFVNKFYCYCVSRCYFVRNSFCRKYGIIIAFLADWVVRLIHKCKAINSEGVRHFLVKCISRAGFQISCSSIYSFYSSFVKNQELEEFPTASHSRTPATICLSNLSRIPQEFLVYSQLMTLMCLL